MKEKFTKYVVGLIVISTILRFFIAYFIEFGNDEVYYWTYALYPDWSHFDHPPMIGYMIQLFTGNLSISSEWAVRLPSVVLGAVDTWMMFAIGKRLKNELTGLYAAILYTVSIYSFLIVGVFILPDTPQIFFMLLAFYSFIKALDSEELGKKEKKSMLLAGLFTGLGIFSKYTAIYMWVGAALFVLFFKRKWFKEITLYIAGFITLLFIIPILYWNDVNDWISFTFHGNRVDVTKYGLRLDYFFSELGGEILYNNPVYFVICIISIVYCLRYIGRYLSKEQTFLVLFMGLPIIFTFLGFSLFRHTLPHWSAPGYVMLMPLAAAYLATKFQRNLRPKTIPWPLQIGIGLLILVLLLGVLQIKLGIFRLDKSKVYTELGEDDVSLDLYGWDQIGDEFATVRKTAIEKGQIAADAPIISYKWFPLAHLDYYVAQKEGINALAIGELKDIHKYAWINHNRGGFHKGMDAWYITTSRNYKDPNRLYKNYFEEIIPVDTIQIYRGNRIENRAFVFELKDLKEIPKDPLKAIH